MLPPERISKVISWLILDQPFFGTLLAATQIVPDSAYPTLVTNGIDIFYNPAYIHGLSDAELAGVLLHEVHHIIYLHCDPDRRANRMGPIWNMAADYAVNRDVLKMGMSLPRGVLHDPAFDGEMTEEIYDELIRRGRITECLDFLLSMRAHERGAILARLREVEGLCQGSVPASVARWIREMGEPKVPWERVLQRFLAEHAGVDDARFLPPNRRHLWQGRYLPSTYHSRISNLVVAVDTSSSIDQKLLGSFAAELSRIQGLCDECLVMTCDAEVHETVKLTAVGKFLQKLSFKGGGNTDFRPVFDHVQRANRRPQALMYLTDGHGVYPAGAPGYPVLWCLSKRGKTPWGITLLLRGMLLRGMDNRQSGS